MPILDNPTFEEYVNRTTPPKTYTRPPAPTAPTSNQPRAIRNLPVPHPGGLAPVDNEDNGASMEGPRRRK